MSDGQRIRFDCGNDGPKTVVLRSTITVEITRPLTGATHTIHGMVCQTLWGLVDEKGNIVPRWLEAKMDFNGT